MTEDDDFAERARKLFSGRVEFLLSAPQLKFLPDPVLPEIAFAGRSNVGKSSLINAVTGRKAIARASVTPGRTQELNFFEVGDPVKFRLVDMPGYGFAKAPVKVVEKWKNLVNNYLRGRAVLHRTLVLVDSRHGLKPPDREILALLDATAVPCQIVLTKIDKVGPAARAKVVEAVEAELKSHPAAFPTVRLTSSQSGEGIPELRAALAALALPAA